MLYAFFWVIPRRLISDAAELRRRKHTKLSAVSLSPKKPIHFTEQQISIQNSQIALHTHTFFRFTSRYFRRTLRSVQSCLLPYFATCFDTTAPSTSGVHVKFEHSIAPPPSHHTVTAHSQFIPTQHSQTVFTCCHVPVLCGTNCLFMCHADLSVCRRFKEHIKPAVRYKSNSLSFYCDLLTGNWLKKISNNALFLWEIREGKISGTCWCCWWLKWCSAFWTAEVQFCCRFC
jgi:hypothetical protein